MDYDEQYEDAQHALGLDVLDEEWDRDEQDEIDEFLREVRRYG